MTDLAEQSLQLLDEQNNSWELLRQNRAALALAVSRSFDFGEFAVRVQFNPGRMASSLSQLDEKSIRERPCFLCDANRPAEQRSLRWQGGFKLLCNPFPILPEHFTIVHEKHQPQAICESLPAMLDLAAALGEKFVVFYNGPECGASAPDHLHLQAGTHGVMPVDIDCKRMSRPIAPGVFASANYLRRFFLIESSERQTVLALFQHFYESFRQLQPEFVEPLINVICSFHKPSWRMVIFPRGKHRPSFYFEPAHRRLLLSPGTVDMGGLVILPVERDFQRITKENLAQMYEEVTLNEKLFARLCEMMK